MSNEIKITVNGNLTNALRDVERAVYQLAIEDSKWNQSRAAKALGVSRGTLRSKLKEYFGDKYVNKNGSRV